jgi:molecular chaperone GrpE
MDEVMTDTRAPDAAEAEGPDKATAPADAAANAGAPAFDPVAAEKETAELKDKLLRALAEMENLRRRTEREVADARLYGITLFARDTLTVADNMNRALQALDAELREKADASVKALLDGVELTERELLNVLEKHGVRKVEPTGEKFDPNLHQAMYEEPDSTVPAGTITQVIQPGYTIGERVLRPAFVVVAKGGAKAPAGPSANDNSPSSETELP